MNPGLLFVAAVILAVALLLWLDRNAHRVIEEETRQAQARYNRAVQVASGERLVLDAGARPVVEEDPLQGVPL